MTTPLQRMLDDKERHTPETGFHLVGLDDFEEAGEMAYVIAWFATRPEAEGAMAARRAANPDEVLVVLGAAL